MSISLIGNGSSGIHMKSWRNRYPIYIPSKGRFERALTPALLDRIGADYYVIVEPLEFDEYAKHLPDPSRILVLPMEFKTDYDTAWPADWFDRFPNNTRNPGSGPARVFAGQHARANKTAKHWVMDDNIRHLKIRWGQQRWYARSPLPFRMIEDWSDQWINLGMSGPHYAMFIPDRRRQVRPITYNTRIYSCNLINHECPCEWRGQYNEDTILSIDMLKAGWGTALFNHLLIDKLKTGAMRGGNTDTIYTLGTEAKSELLRSVHPDVTRVGERFGRTHHYVNYKAFTGVQLHRKPGSPPLPDYNLTLVSINEAGDDAIEPVDSLSAGK